MQLLTALGLFPPNGRRDQFPSSIRRFSQPMRGQTSVTHPTMCSFSSRCSGTHESWQGITIWFNVPSFVTGPTIRKAGGGWGLKEASVYSLGPLLPGSSALTSPPGMAGDPTEQIWGLLLLFLRLHPEGEFYWNSLQFSIWGQQWREGESLHSK